MKQCNTCGIDVGSYNEVFRSPIVNAVGGAAPEWKEGDNCPLCVRDYFTNQEEVK